MFPMVWQGCCKLSHSVTVAVQLNILNNLNEKSLTEWFCHKEMLPGSTFDHQPAMPSKGPADWTDDWIDETTFWVSDCASFSGFALSAFPAKPLTNEISQYTSNMSHGSRSLSLCANKTRRVHQSPRSEPEPTPNPEETELSRFAASQFLAWAGWNWRRLQQPLNIFEHFWRFWFWSLWCLCFREIQRYWWATGGRGLRLCRRLYVEAVLSWRSLELTEVIDCHCTQLEYNLNIFEILWSSLNICCILLHFTLMWQVERAAAGCTPQAPRPGRITRMRHTERRPLRPVRPVLRPVRLCQE